MEDSTSGWFNTDEIAGSGHDMALKRKRLTLNDSLLADAMHVFGTKTHSATVNLALEEVLRVKKIQTRAQFFGSGIWLGNLAVMREDHRCPAIPRRREVRPNKTPM